MDWTLAVDIGDTSVGVAGASETTTWSVRQPVPAGAMPLRELNTRTQAARQTAARVLRAARGARTRPGRLVLVHPNAWTEGDLAGLREAARLADMPAPEFAAAAVAGAGLLGPAGPTAVYDLGGNSADLAVVATTGSGHQVVAAARTPESFGGIDLDDILLRLVAGHAAERDPDAWAVAERSLSENAGHRLELLRTVTAARQALSADRVATVNVPGLSGPVRVTRGEFENLAEPELVAVLDRLDEVLAGAGIGHAEVDEALLIGGLARMPLLADLVATRFRGRVRVDVEPELTAVRGALGTAAAGHVRTGHGVVADELRDYFDAPSGGDRR